MTEQVAQKRKQARVFKLNISKDGSKQFLKLDLSQYGIKGMKIQLQDNTVVSVTEDSIFFLNEKSGVAKATGKEYTIREFVLPLE